MDLWQIEHGKEHVKPLQAKVWRIVEDQTTSSTRKLVDTSQEHELLEEMIEGSKPSTLLSRDYHYLLATPFRYPPLHHGSRFATRHQPSLWYGSREISTALAEVAYYRLLLLSGTTAEYDQVLSRHTAFAAKVATLSGVYLNQTPFEKHRKEISSSMSYEISQLLGTAMREIGVEAFWYYSARDIENGVNIGIFTPKAFLNKKPIAQSFQSWECVTTSDTIEFIQHASSILVKKNFNTNQFQINVNVSNSKAKNLFR